MNNLISRLWNDDAGYILSAESVFFVTITVLGLVTGWVAVRNSVVSELTEVGNAIANLNQCYSFSGTSNCTSSTCGSIASGDTTQSMSPAVNVTAPAGLPVDVSRCSP